MSGKSIVESQFERAANLIGLDQYMRRILMRLAARSNWLSTIDLPDIVVRAGALPERPVAVTGEDLRGKSVRRQAAAGQTGRRVLGLGQGMRHVGAARPSPAAVREHADHVRAVGWG